MYFLIPYGTATTVFFPMVKRSVVDLAVSADWTPVNSDTRISIDGASDSYVTGTVTAVATATALWSLALSATETQGRFLSVRILDAATKAVEDQALFFQTYGNSSASIVRNISTDPATANVTQWSGTSVATPDTAGYPKVTVKSGTGTGEINLSSGVADADMVKVSTDATAANNLEAILDGTGGATLYATLYGSVLGSVTGSVASVTGNVGGNVAGNVVGSVASVTAAVGITSNIKKNQALAKFPFILTDSSTHLPVAGKTPTVTRSLDGAAFAAGNLANVAELSDGVYTVDFAAGDLNANVVILKATAAGCDTTLRDIITSP